MRRFPDEGPSETEKPATWRRVTCAQIYTILLCDIYEKVYCKHNEGTLLAPN